MKKRIALLGITHESNTFVKELTTLSHFEKGHWCKGPAIRSLYANAFHEIGGMIEAIDDAGFELVPIMYAEATPSGTITAETCKALVDELLLLLEKELPVDACLVVPHGAGVAASNLDLDGHWLSMLRERVGDAIPIIGSIDPHANVSPLMIASTDALVAYKTNPHIDQRATGKAAANLLIDLLNSKTKPLQVLRQLPLAISIEQQLTQNDPCKSLLHYAHAFVDQETILSVSVVLGFPYADVPEMGSSIIVVANNNIAAANKVADAIEKYILDRKETFNGIKQDIPTLIQQLPAMEKPILMLDMGDNVGGGANGNSVYLSEALEQTKSNTYFICIYDPAAVSIAAGHSIGDSFELTIGERPDGVLVKKQLVRLLQLANGIFEETTPRHGGQIHFDMGPIAIVQTVCGGTIMLTSLRVPPYSLQQLLSFNIDPANFDVIVAKGVNAPIAAYSGICKTILQVNTPGVTAADMTLFSYQHRRKPLYPFENI